MRADEVRDLSRLVGVTLEGGAARLSEVHDGVAGRTFRPLGPLGAPVRVVHDAVAHGAYRGVGLALRTAARGVGAAASALCDGRPLDDVPAGRTALAVLNGAHGDLVSREAPALALRMSVRHAGRDVPLERAALRAAYPAASTRIVVFLHGLTEHEGAWCYKAEAHHGRRDVSYGSLLEADLGLTPVYLRYNTGLHVSDNGRSLADLLTALVDLWPVPPEDVVLVGHSMGGLVARSALHLAGSGTPDPQPWTQLVRDTVTLGTPHLGAPLERNVHRLAGSLARLPETRPLATLLAARSVGIKDLGRGTLVEDDWAGRDLDSTAPRPHTHVPLHDGARHSVVLATLAADPGSRAAHLLGDLLVPPLSAVGDTGDEHRLAFPADRVVRVGGLHHFDLLNHPEVYACLRRWLAPVPDCDS